MLLQQLSSLSSPLSDQQVTSLQQATANMSAVELSWVSGYLAGLAQSSDQSAIVAAPVPSATLTVLYGSQTGNAKGVAKQVAEAATAQGINVSLVSMADYKTKALKDETHLLVIVSTHGEGEAPDDAEQLHQFLASKRAPKLAGLEFAVLGLGDTSYEFYCQTAIDFELRLSALGAKSILDRRDCDVDYDSDVLAWQGQIIELLNETLSQPVAATAVSAGVATTTSQYSKQNPLSATLLASNKITGRGANKDVRHIEISLEDSGLSYQPGDALGVWFDNDPILVNELIELVGLQAEQLVNVNDQEISLAQALIQHYELTQLHPGFVSTYGEATAQSNLVELGTDKAVMREYIANRQVIDVIRQNRGSLSSEQLLAALRKLTPRLYSIASSVSEVDEEVHLTVAVVEYDAFDKAHQGAASSYLSHRLAEGDTLRVFVEHNDNFRLPSADKSVIMIGPGTGIAPFRSFLQQRDNDDASGQNWLFFGNQHFTDDFLYQTELQDFQKRGVLNRIDLAFSRDQAHKVYVQDRIKEQGKDLYQWLEDGASLYICGDGNQMAKDVHQALVEAIELHGNKTNEQAQQYLTQLKTDKRYQKDVY
ncbi:MAG: assimilatory sulfite reductase (NADPH) flavoprotein subunit [Gammaproteobacteria bacterium]|nr:assimilatory sulfite reductase (NADPH) flavoprotein subunit [Gammaproteobacteria bacterium]